MKYAVLGFVLWFALYLTGSAESAESVEYRIVQIEAGTIIMVARDQQWKVCSDYFYAVETPNGKKVYFHIETETNGKMEKKPIYAPIGQVKFEPEVNKSEPSLSFSRSGSTILYVLRMNVTDYVAGLPCLAKGG